MFKRPRLSAPFLNVNAAIALGLLFTVSACSGDEPAPPDEPETVPETPETTEDTAEAPTPPQDGDTLPAVWGTRTLEGPIRAIGIAGGIGSTFAVSYEGGGLQLFNFEGDRISGVGDQAVSALGVGRFAMLSGTPVTLFPGLDDGGDLKLWLHGEGMEEAIAYDLSVDQAGPAAGLCSAPPLEESDGLMRLAFWNEDAPRTLQSGRIVEVEEELVWLADEPVDADEAISACVLTSNGAVTFSGPLTDAALLRRRGRETLMALSDDGVLTATLSSGEEIDLGVLDGISVVAPDEPVAMAAVGDARGGGYPGGLIVIGGEVETGDHRVIMVDPSRLTLTSPALSPSVDLSPN